MDITQCYLPPGRDDIPAFTPARHWICSPCPRLHIAVVIAISTTSTVRFEPGSTHRPTCPQSDAIILLRRAVSWTFMAISSSDIDTLSDGVGSAETT